MKREAIVERLPDIFKQAATDEENPLAHLLGVMEELHARDEDILAGFGRYVDPRWAPDEFVPYLAAWVDYAWLVLDPPDNPYTDVEQPFAGGVGRLRELIASAAAESKWRGTSAGLVRLLERATGVEGYRIEETVTDDRGKNETRIVLRFHPRVAPIKCGIFPLLKNQPELVAKAREVQALLRPQMNVFYDETGAIGRRYRRQDEAGTPFGITIDFETLGERDPALRDTVTLRHRDSMQQERIAIAELPSRLSAATG